VNLGADERCDFVNFSLTFGEQIWEARIGVFAVVVVLEGCQRGVSKIN
jgi:hypothetical protein